jgi:hypothetical protein
MGFPLLLALMAASTAANYAGQKKVDRARSRTLQDELLQRKQVQKKSEEASQRTQDLVIGTAQKEKDAQAARAAATAAATAPPVGGVAPALPASALETFAPTDSKVTIEENLRRAAETRGKLRRIGDARANLDEYGNVMAGQSQAITRNAQDQQQAITAGNNYEQYVMPAKMNAAMGAGRDMFTLGDVLQLAASLYAPYGLGKAGSAATAAWDVGTQQQQPPVWGEPGHEPWQQYPILKPQTSRYPA